MAEQAHIPSPTDKADSVARRFVLGLAVVMLVSGAVFSLTGYLSGPPIGDLTRISGLSERDYGWQGAEPGFAENHFRQISQDALMAGKGQGGILVFGDSFSAPQEGNITWMNTLYARTGQPIDRVEIESLAEIEAYFLSDAFRTGPPEAVIIEMAERTVFRRAKPLMKGAKCLPLTAPRPLALNPTEVTRTKWTRRTTFEGFDEIMSWGALSLRLRLFAASKTVVTNLSRSDLFSSVRADRLLIYHSDILRHTLPEIAPYDGAGATRATVCAIRDLVNAAQGRSRVFVTIAPDKRSIYENWIKERLPAKEVHFLESLPEPLTGAYIDLYGPLLRDVKNAVKDVYFPDDTHWSALGHARVGNLIADRIGSPD